MENMQGIFDLMQAKVDELEAYFCTYQICCRPPDPRAVTCRVQSDVLLGLLRSCGVQHKWPSSEGIAAAVPHQERYGSLTAFVTEIGGQHTAVLFEDECCALEEQDRFDDEHETLIYDGEVSCDTVWVDLARLTPSLIHASDPRIAYVFISAWDGHYAVSLHDDTLGAMAAHERFEIDHPANQDDEITYSWVHAIALPPGTGWTHWSHECARSDHA